MRISISGVRHALAMSPWLVLAFFAKESPADGLAVPLPSSTREVVSVVCGKAAGDAGANAIRLNPADHKVQGTIAAEFLGTNILYWIDDDAAWASGHERAKLQRLGLKTLRYPGGEVADNYDWERNAIERRNSFPREANSEAERDGRLDYREFLAQAHRLGATNLFFVVNLEGAFFQPGNLHENVERYAEKAARWVKAVREAGYFVPYWEIGNESYLRTAYPLRAQEYAWALKQFSLKMKAADPRIRIGAIGPFGAEGEEAVGFADLLGDKALTAYRQALVSGNDNPCGEARRWACAKKLGGKLAGLEAAKWWEVVTAEAGKAFDYVVIHRYRSERLTRDKDIRFDGPIALARELREFKQYLRERKGSDVTVALTEWNTPAPFHNAMSEMQHAMDVMEQLGNLIEGGVDYALYWPWRMKGVKFPLLGGGWADQSTYELMLLFQEYHGAHLLSGGIGRNEDVYILPTGDAGGVRYLFVNHGAKEQKVSIALTTMALAGVKWKVLSESEDGRVAVLGGSHNSVPPGCGLRLWLGPTTVLGLQLVSE